MDVLKVEHLFQSYGGLSVLADVSFSLKAGERLAIIGPNGAGKTTLFNVLSGFISPVSGRIHLLGTDVTTMSSHKRAALGLARSFQINSLFSQLPLLHNVLLAIQGVQTSRYQMIRPITAYRDNLVKAQELLELVGLWDERKSPVAMLGHGQQRQVEIILALASKPRLLLLDEPSAGLTAAESVNLGRIIQNLTADTTVFFCAHDLDLVFSLAERVVVLYYGQLVAQGIPEQIQVDPKVREIYLGTEQPDA
ncbi:MAG TPA: ABC transporter ATP-binding protein [Syntrophorhabdales bacterium]|nr:ABC transporter ATP-binding protein [Syntrophorhabdales bacterium]